MNHVNIRKALEVDAAYIAHVHLNAWKESYINLLPKNYLNTLTLSFKSRLKLWKSVIDNTGQLTLVAESEEHGIVGFITGNKGRDEMFENYLEVYSIYLLQAYHKQKIGFHLLKQFFDHHIGLGFEKAYLWVLKNNPTIEFYKRAGGKFNNIEKQEEIANQIYTEQMYTWESLRL